MSERTLYQDGLVTVTADQVVAADFTCAIGEVRDVRLRGGTGIEEKIFLSLIAFFALGVAVVGLVLQDRGELLLGLGLAAVTIWLVLQKCQLVLRIGTRKVVLLRHRDVAYVRKIRNAIDDAMEAARAEAGS